MHELGEPIHTYTRAQAIADGALIAVPEETAREAGFRVPVAFTDAAWADCVAWTQDDNDRKGAILTEDGRLWDVLVLVSRVIWRNPRTPRVTVRLYRVPRDGAGTVPRRVTLEAVCGPGDDGRPVVTIQQHGED